jgi:hypothetical protein
MGLSLATFVGLFSWYNRDDPNMMRNSMGYNFNSGVPYWPSTVSELVMDTSTPSGKSFFGLSLIAAIFLLTSWYPWQLRNVYVDSTWLKFSRLLLNIRTLLPPLGMFLVASVPTPHLGAANRSFGDSVTGVLHTFARYALYG